ncbi:hydrogenase expression/formation protein [Sedimenticola thiotaurini]|uniref:Hydrogenase expression protein HupH n=1 Tax=Sedimenticola thiotaurini TaxID=1543721 RepID=A0A0F7K3F1_9GAMM|nr:hydrogenase expression/formation protein [Sedimenticola thiotaurini]AKH21755.1 hydrogenase expression protein HupH [Sedimenticola thiotaurini]
MGYYELPAGTLGVGTQPPEEDGAELNYQPMPEEMATFAMPDIPEPELVADCLAARSLLDDVLRAMGDYRVGEPSPQFVLDQLDKDNLELVDQMLGEGEVSIVVTGQYRARIQESVLAGLWRVRYLDDQGKLVQDTLEVADIPRLVRDGTFASAADRLVLPDGALPEGVLNAPPLVAELDEKSTGFRPGVQPHVINLTLLPQTEQDLGFLDQLLGAGTVTILSRGYGNCRITSTNTRFVWWVQYFNSQDKSILNTLEVTDVPEVACAAQEDIVDSAQRLDEILEIYR